MSGSRWNELPRLEGRRPKEGALRRPSLFPEAPRRGMGGSQVVHNQGMESLTPIRVRYAETDAMGIVHHGSYPVWMELGRSDLLRQLGQSYAEWEAQGVRMTVGEIRVKYRAPAYYDEIVEVRTRIVEAGRRRIVFTYDISRDGARLAEGESVHLVTGSDGRARVLPDAMLTLVRGAL